MSYFCANSDVNTMFVLARCVIVAEALRDRMEIVSTGVVRGTPPSCPLTNT